MNQTNNKYLIGTAIDVSGSMKSKYPKNLDNDLETSKIDSIFNLIDDIIKHEPESENHFFSLAFGLDGNQTCDLISLLDYLCPPPEKQLKLLKRLLSENGLCHEYILESDCGNFSIESKFPLIILLENNGVKNCEKYVNKYVKSEDAGRFFTIFAQDKELLKLLIDNLPYACREDNILQAGIEKLNSSAGFFSFGFYDSEKKVEDTVEEEVERAKKLEKQFYTKILSKHQNRSPSIYTYKQVIKIFKTLSNSKKSNELDSSALVKKIEDIIYDRTPMCKALDQMIPIFNNPSYSEKMLLLVSDGEPTDGDPQPFCNELKQQGVKIFACFLSTDNLQFPRRLYDAPEASWDEAQLNMFNMSSLVPASSSSLVLLRIQGWVIPTSGEVRLYAQVNHPEVVREFTNLVNHIYESDTLIDLIGLVSLETYINNSIQNFIPQHQGNDPVCFAHVVAAVQHLVLSRFYGDATKYQFEDLKAKLIQAYGDEDGASTEQVLQETCEPLGLQFKEVDEQGARQALLERRPVAAIYQLDQTEWDLFSNFYENNRRGVLETRDLFHENNAEEGDGHAVVLIRCNHDSLTFMNSWGTEWADYGFFKIRNAQVLRMRFFDVYFPYDQEVSQENQELQRQHVIRSTQNYLDQTPNSLRKLPYKCPCCNKEEKIEKFQGNVFKALCPNCENYFKPSGVSLLVNLYTRNYSDRIEDQQLLSIEQKKKLKNINLLGIIVDLAALKEIFDLKLLTSILKLLQQNYNQSNHVFIIAIGSNNQLYFDLISFLMEIKKENVRKLFIDRVEKGQQNQNQRRRQQQHLAQYKQKQPLLYQFNQALQIIKNFICKVNSRYIQNLILKLKFGVFDTPSLGIALEDLIKLYANEIIFGKKLIIISSINSNLDDPKSFSNKLKENGVIIFVFILIPFIQWVYRWPKIMYSKAQKISSISAKKLLQISSPFFIQHPCFTFLKELGWSIKIKRDYRLLALTNGQNQFEEFIQFSNIIQESDVLINLIGENNEFNVQLKLLQGVPPYAIVAAAVRFMDLRRFQRQENIPNLMILIDDLTYSYRNEEQIAVELLTQQGQSYGLKFKEVDELGARMALFQGRPVASVFYLNYAEFEMLASFFEKNKKGVLEATDINSKRQYQGTQGHAVVLTKCSHGSLTFMNPSETRWGNSGFFSIRNAQVFRMKFYDIS